ncbi:MAG: tetratricopeptide repeat protein [Solirubrobacterales bacterium]|nr:tetratricopeptide repeat protein [Solirubrobacterales bacterium]MBV9715628.1 tetratricopeptide repeat protein [Solirubrobacterales bacterium]
MSDMRMSSTVADARNRARRLFDGAEFDESLEVAERGLAEAPDDVELLVLAGRAGVEAGAPAAVDHLRRATELAPDDAGAWHHLGEALAAEGRMEEADQAFRRTVELDPEDQVALTHLGHTALATGRNEEGVGYLARAADIAHAFSTASVSLVDMYRSFGQYGEALEHARRVAHATADDPLGWLDVAELSLQVGRLDESRTTFDRLRELDDVPGHEAYPLHGMLLVEIRRQRWDAAEDLAGQALTIDPHGLGTDVAAFTRAQHGEAPEGAEPPPTQVEVEQALFSSLADYRRVLADSRRLGAGDIVG